MSDNSRRSDVYLWGDELSLAEIDGQSRGVGRAGRPLKMVLERPESPRREFREKALPLLEEVYETAVLMMGRFQGAEDLVVKTFSLAWNDLEQDNTVPDVRVRLYKVMVDLFRRRLLNGRSPSSPSGFDAGPEAADGCLFHQIVERFPASSLDPFKEVSGRLKDKDFRDALSALPSEQRTAVIFSDLRRFSLPELAVVLERPIESARSVLTEGRNRLQELLWKLIPVDIPIDVCKNNVPNTARGETVEAR